MPTPFSAFVDGGVPVTGDRVVGLRANTNTIFDLVIAPFSVNINQNAHGLIQNNVVRLNGNLYITALADNAVNAEVVGIVSAITSVDQFVLQIAGPVENFVGLVPGDVYYLDPVVPGGITNVEPNVAGQISKPILIAYSATGAYFYNFRGQQL